MKKTDGLHIQKVLNAMWKYYQVKNRNFYLDLAMAHCNLCKSVTSVGGHHMEYIGSGCGESDYELIKSRQKCQSCNSDKFIPISPTDMGKLREVHGEKTPEILLASIDNGLKGTEDNSAEYNEHLLRIAKKWDRLSQKRKIEEINTLFYLQDELAHAKKRVASLENELLAE